MTIFHEKVSVLNGFCSNPLQARIKLNQLLTPLVVLMLVLLHSASLQAQADEMTAAERAEAEQIRQTIEMVTNGGLVVRLPSKSRQLAALDEVLSGDGLGSATRERIQKRRDDLQEERDYFNRFVIETFAASYAVGPVYFVYDSLNIEAVSGTVFLDETLEFNPEISGPQSPYLLLRNGPLEGYARDQGYLLTDQNGNELPAGFPQVFGFNNLHHLNLANIEDPRHGERRKYSEVIIRLADTLNKVIEEFEE